MMHSEFVLRPEFASTKYFEVFAFLVHFQATHLKSEIEGIIGSNLFAKLLKVEESRRALTKKAHQRIEEEGIDLELVLFCTDCENDTFVIQDEINTCYTCRYNENVFECAKCEAFVLGGVVEDFSDAFDTDYDEERVLIMNDFGYKNHLACPECINEIREDIAIQRSDDDGDWNQY